MCCKTRSNSVLHYGPIIALSLIAFITTSTVWCIFSMLKPLEYAGGMMVLAQFLTIVVGIVACFFLAVYKGGGAIPLEWHPENEEDEKRLQFCKLCNGFKPPRSHHDHVSGRCIAKMDHFCPWINSAVGNRNHVDFLGFVSLVPLGCIYATSIQAIWLWNFMPELRHWQQVAHFHPAHFNSMLYVIFGLACAVAVGLAVGALGVFQWMGVWCNTTQIEEWIIEKANDRPRDKPFVFPYNLGGAANIGEVFTRWYSGDGTEWTVREGSHPYALTEEQLAQKARKRAKTATYKITVSNSRWLRGVEFGFRVWWSSQWPLEPRIYVKPGDYVRAWAYEGDWLYGEVVVPEADGFEAVKPRQRGWFPDKCIADDEEGMTESDAAPETDFGCIGSLEPDGNLKKNN